MLHINRVSTGEPHLYSSQTNRFSNFEWKFSIIFSIRQNLKKGVIRDYEQAQQRKIANTYKLQQQHELTKILKDDQLKRQTASAET